MPSEPEATSPTAVEETPEKEMPEETTPVETSPEEAVASKVEVVDSGGFLKASEVDDEGERRKANAAEEQQEKNVEETHEDGEAKVEDEALDVEEDSSKSKTVDVDQEAESGRASGSTSRWKSKPVHEIYLTNCLLVKPRTSDMLLDCKKKDLTVDMLKKGLTETFYSRFVAKIRNLQHKAADRMYFDVDVSECQLGPPAMKLLADFFKKLYQEPTPICIGSLRAYRNNLGDEGAKVIADLIIHQPGPMTQLHLSHNNLTGLGAACVTMATAASEHYPFRTGKTSWVGLWLRMEQNGIEAPSTIIERMQKKRFGHAPMWIVDASFTNKSWGPSKAPSWVTSREVAPQAILYIFTLQAIGAKGLGQKPKQETDALVEAATKSVEAAATAVQEMQQAAASSFKDRPRAVAHAWKEEDWEDNVEEAWEETSYDQPGNSSRKPQAAKPRLTWTKKQDKEEKDQDQDRDKDKDKDKDQSAVEPRPTAAVPSSSSKGAGKALQAQRHKEKDKRQGDWWDEEKWDGEGWTQSEWEEWKDRAKPRAWSVKETKETKEREEPKDLGRWRTSKAEEKPQKGAPEEKPEEEQAARPKKTRDPERVPEDDGSARGTAHGAAGLRTLSKVLGNALQAEVKSQKPAKPKGQGKQARQSIDGERKKPREQQKYQEKQTPPRQQPESPRPQFLSAPNLAPKASAEDAAEQDLDQAKQKKGKNKMRVQADGDPDQEPVIQPGLIYQ